MQTPQPRDKRSRHEAVRRILRARAVGTQEELGELLAAEGFEVTQATLSRDLAQLGALRVSRPEGGTVYDLDPARIPTDAERIREVGETILSIEENEALVVLRTRAGAAAPVALVIDLARVPECLGTIAGDDTIFATPARGTSTRRLSQLLRTLFQKGEVR